MIITGSVANEEWNEHVMNGEAFVAQGIQSAVVGQIGQIQLLNPVASGVRLRMRNLETMPIFGIGINTNPRRHDPPLAVLGAFSGPHNLLGDPTSPAPAAEIRTLSAVGPALGSPFWLILSAGSTRKDYPALNLDWGHDLLPGQGILLTSATGGFILAGFMWVEIPL